MPTNPTRSILLHFFSFALTLSAMFFTNLSLAQEQEVTPEIAKKVLQKLKENKADLTFSTVKTSPIPGLYEVKIENNNQILFVSADGDYFISGDMYTVKEGKFVNLQEPARRQQLLSSIPLENMIIYSAQGQVKNIIYVFTDVDCPYCAKLHYEIPELNKRGVEVRYLAYPRTGLYTPSHSKIATVWCSENPKKLLPKMQHGEQIELIDCDSNAVETQYHIGNQLGVNGTPTIVLPNGYMFSGYHSTQAIIDIINKAEK